MMNRKRQHSVITGATKVNQPMNGGLPPGISLLGDLDDDKNRDEVYNAGDHSLFIVKENLPPEILRLPSTAIKISALDAQTKETFKAVTAENDDTVYFNVMMAPPREYERYNLYLGGFMTGISGGRGGNLIGRNETASLNLMLARFNKTNPGDKITCFINSDGGSIAEGLRFVSAIRRNFFNLDVTTVVESGAYSMGAGMFTLGHTRVLHEDSDIMLHDYSCGNSGTGSKIADYIKHKEETINGFMYETYVVPGFITEEEFKEFKLGKEFWFTASECAKRGIATHIVLRSGDEVTSEEYFKMKGITAVTK